MMRKGLLVIVVMGMVAFATAWGQDASHGRAQNGKSLVAWTQDQKAQPMPETQMPNTPAQDDVQKAPAAQAFTGMIVKSGGSYVLQTVDNVTYQLDDQEKAKAYEGKQVQVTGSLDKSANMIKVRDIKQTA